MCCECEDEDEEEHYNYISLWQGLESCFPWDWPSKATSTKRSLMAMFKTIYSNRDLIPRKEFEWNKKLILGV